MPLSSTDDAPNSQPSPPHESRRKRMEQQITIDRALLEQALLLVEQVCGYDAPDGVVPLVVRHNLRVALGEITP